MNRKIAFVRPPLERLTLSPPIHLGYLSSVMRKAGWETRILDCSARSTSECLDELRVFGPDVVAITCMTVEMNSAARLVPILREAAPNATVALGGPHPTALPLESLRQSGADIAVMGEGERTIVELCGRLESGTSDLDGIRGVAWRSMDSVRRNEPREYIEELDTIPTPAWDQMPPAVYSERPWQMFKRRAVVAPVLTSRGCPYGCTFCASVVLGRKVRVRSTTSVVDEMELLVRDYGVGEFQIMDDNFTMSRAHAEGVCEEMIKRRLDVAWKTPNGVRIETIDEELIALMKRSGCYQLGFGIESGNAEILKMCKKNLDLGIVREKIAIAKRHGVEVYGFFILGLPGETRETLNDTLKMMRAGFNHVSVAYCIPYPGSELFEKYASRDIDDWERFIHFNPFPMSEIPAAELKRWMRTALIRFYLRPSYALGMLKKFSLRQLPSVLKLLYKYLRHND